MLQHGCAPPSLSRLLSSCVKWMCEACLRRGTTDHGRMSLGGAARVMAGTQVVVTTLRLPPRRAATSSKNKPASAASLARPRESVPDAWTPRTVSPSARTRCAASPATSPATASVFVLGVVANRSLPPVRLPALVRRVGLRPSQPPQVSIRGPRLSQLLCGRKAGTTTTLMSLVVTGMSAAAEAPRGVAASKGCTVGLRLLLVARIAQTRVLDVTVLPRRP